jgi:hypothetical protein
MDAPGTFEVGDKRINSSNRKWIAAHQQGVVAQDGPQAGVTHMTRYQSVHTAIGLQPEEVWYHAQHAADRVEGHMAELLEADAINGFALAHETVVTGDICRCDTGHLRAHGFGVAAVVEDLTRIEADAVEGRQGTELDIIFEAAAAQIPQVLEQEGRGDDGWPAVEGMAGFNPDGGSPSQRVQFFEQGDTVSSGAQANGGGESAETTANHDRAPRA